MGVMDDSELPDELTTFIARELGVQASELPKPGIWSQSGNTIGALALRMNSLTFDQIDDIIEAQEGEPKLFGEIAIELEHLGPHEVAQLLELQRFHRGFEQGELVFMSGALDLSSLLELYARFLRRDGAGDSGGGAVLSRKSELHRKAP
jgi:hypothetical protein